MSVVYVNMYYDLVNLHIWYACVHNDIAQVTSEQYNTAFTQWHR